MTDKTRAELLAQAEALEWASEQGLMHGEVYALIRDRAAALRAQADAAGEPEPFAHLCVINTDAGPTKFFTAPGDPRAIAVFTSPPADRARELLKEALEQLESTDYQADIELRIAAFLKEDA